MEVNSFVKEPCPEEFQHPNKTIIRKALSGKAVKLVFVCRADKPLGKSFVRDQKLILTFS